MMDREFLKKLGQRLKQLRLQNKLTQEILAEKLDIHPTYVGKLESGKNNPSILLIYKFSHIFNIELKELFNFEKT